ncbi:hypothetical protein Pstr01_13080 [Pseudomonas straminea]|nr:hypothetical protein Pstr01_13080 [Pseudomonas straminea]
MQRPSPSNPLEQRTEGRGMTQRVPDLTQAPDLPGEPPPLGQPHEPDNDALPDKPQPDPV